MHDLLSPCILKSTLLIILRKWVTFKISYSVGTGSSMGVGSWFSSLQKSPFYSSYSQYISLKTDFLYWNRQGFRCLFFSISAKGKEVLYPTIMNYKPIIKEITPIQYRECPQRSKTEKQSWNSVEFQDCFSIL